MLAGFPITSGEENEMSKAYTCRDIGMECEWSACAETEGELLLLIGEHFAKVHEVTETPPCLLAKVREAIKNG